MMDQRLDAYLSELRIRLRGLADAGGHDAQELTGVLQESFAGLLLGLMYLGSRRNLTIPIVAHGVSNTVAFILIHFDRYPGV